MAARPTASLALILTLVTNFISVATASDVRRIGYLTLDSAEVTAPFAASFRSGLAEAGFVEGRNISIVSRYAAYDRTVLSPLVSELIASDVELLLADGTQAALAAKRATRSIPIVATGGDLVGAGVVTSLARPGGNVTGMTLISAGLAGKRLALLKDIAPRTDTVGVLFNPDNPSSAIQLREAQAAAPGLGLKVQAVPIRRQADIDQMVPSLAGRVNAMLICDDFVLDAFRPQIGRHAIRDRIPWICSYAMPEDKICLMWYGPDLRDVYARAGRAVGRILNGSKPGDLPVEQPTKFVLGINANTAGALGISIPQSLLLTADEIIR